MEIPKTKQTTPTKQWRARNAVHSFSAHIHRLGRVEILFRGSPFLGGVLPLLLRVSKKYITQSPADNTTLTKSSGPVLQT